MSRVKLSNYLNKIEAKYVNARESWEAIQKKVAEENIRFSSINWANYSIQGIAEEKNRHDNTIKELYSKLEDIRKDFEENTSGVMKKSDEVFNRVFKYSPADIDQNGITIINNGSLNNKELIDLAEQYRSSGNYTMYYLIADKISVDAGTVQTKDDREALGYKEMASYKRKNREDHRILEEYSQICLKALRNEDYLSNGVHRAHDDFYSSYKMDADEIEARTESPFDE